MAARLALLVAIWSVLARFCRGQWELPDCACVVGRKDCEAAAAKEAVTRALRYLRENDCKRSCRRDLGCRDAFFEVQQHMDGCPAGTLVNDLEREKYEYDVHCHHCNAAPPENSSLSSCPNVDCGSESIVEAWSNLKANCEDQEAGGCLSSAQCEEDWLIVYAAMYTCEHFEVHRVIRRGFHEWQRSYCSSGLACSLPESLLEVDCTTDVNVEHQDPYGWIREPDCACLVGPLDCSSERPAIQALEFLRENECGSKCRYSLSCREAFYHLEQFVDGCPVSAVSASVAHEKHRYDDTCSHCWQQRDEQDSLEDCPAIDCRDEGRLLQAWSSLQSCMGDACDTNSQCKQDFQVLSAARATCDHTQMPSVASRGIHSWEEGPCYTQRCNTPLSREVDCDTGINARYAGIFSRVSSSSTSAGSDGGSSASGVAVAAVVLACLSCTAWLVLGGVYAYRSLHQEKEKRILNIIQEPGST